MFLLLFCFFFIVAHSKCTAGDRLIYNAAGNTFQSRMRTFGGAFVSKSEYEEQVVKYYGLSAKCSTCYGDAYICGYDNCKWSCFTEGEKCDICLVEHGCIRAVSKCTGFF